MLILFMFSPFLQTERLKFCIGLHLFQNSRAGLWPFCLVFGVLFSDHFFLIFLARREWMAEGYSYELSLSSKCLTEEVDSHDHTHKSVTFLDFQLWFLIHFIFTSNLKENYCNTIIHLLTFLLGILLRSI
jgi:hypothetical protein